MQVATTPEELLELVEDEEPGREAATLRRAGFVEAAVKRYGHGEREFGLSVGIRFGSREQAVAERDRNAEEVAGDTTPGTTETSLPGVPGSSAAVASASGNGQTFSAGSAIFADGPFAQIAGGPEDVVDPQAVLDAALGAPRGGRGPAGPVDGAASPQGRGL